MAQTTWGIWLGSGEIIFILIFHGSPQVITTWFACSLDAVLASLLANREAAPLLLEEEMATHSSILAGEFQGHRNLEVYSP